jgi:hypothetical protein
MVAIAEHPRERDEGKVAGMGEAMRQAELGLKLFQAEVEKDYDLPGAFKFKEQQDAKIKTLEAEADSLHGKDNMKARAAKGKESAALKADPQYIDACKVVKGLETKHGFFVKSADAPVEEKPVEEVVAEEEKDAKKKEKKDDKKPKKVESAGLSPAEVKELETLKNDLIARKAQLKAEGLSGGQQNKDPQVVEWVKRMNELKEKQDPGCTQKEKKDDKKKSSKGSLTTEEQKAYDALRNEMEIYKLRLKQEFGYTNKDIKADPELAEMDEKIKAFQKRGAV